LLAVCSSLIRLEVRKPRGTTSPGSDPSPLRGSG
jgi:hypothetical protein